MCLSTFYISKINDSNDSKGGGKNPEYFVIIRSLHHSWSGMVLFESGLGLVINTHCEL
jgi:hypothetical protein